MSGMEAFTRCSSQSKSWDLATDMGQGTHLAGVGMRMGLRRGVGSSFSLASGRLRLSAEEGVLGATRGGSPAACVTGAPV